ncbi:hypothetical protein B0H10DRAFT_2033041 [Mycena sp. CBHHK59/15]|nr:hypothetical protein B0H10DRAFT_2033041 [Mycena sp. CBHHK59/15]
MNSSIQLTPSICLMPHQVHLPIYSTASTQNALRFPLSSLHLQATMSSLDTTFGACLIAVIIAAEYYYTHQQDGWPLKLLVAAMMCLETTHQAMITHSIYTYLVTDFNNLLPSTTSSEVVVNGLVTLLAQSLIFHINTIINHQIFTVSMGNRWITAAALLFVLSEFVYVSNPIPWTSFAQTFTSGPHVENLVIAVETLAASGDLFIAGTLSFILLRSRTGFSRSDTMINKLVCFFLGSQTNLFAIGSLLALTVVPKTFIYIVLFFCMGRLYSNSMLAILNARSSIRGDSDGILTSNDMPLSFPSRSALSRSARPNVAFEVNITQAVAKESDVDGDLKSGSN